MQLHKYTSLSGIQISEADRAKMVGMRKLPANKQVLYCKKCVISNQRPRIEFDENGVCNACSFASKKHSQIRWDDREKELVDLLDRHRSKEGRFDVVVPCSGGKDSTRVAHLLKYRYDMHPLSVTWAPHIYTEIGWANLQAMIHSGFDNVLVTPNGKVHRIMTRLAFELIGDPFQPFIYGQMAQPFQVACKYKIPLIFYGENGEAEYGGLKSDEDLSGPPMETFGQRYFSGVMADVFADYGISKTDLQLYRMPPVEDIMEAGVQMKWLGYYHKWVPQENYYYASEHAGFQANPDGRSEGTYSKYASLDDCTDGFHYYLGFVKFGLGRATSDAAHEIRDGHLTREEGVSLVRRFDGEFPKKHFKEFLEYIDIHEDKFWEVINQFRTPHLWEKENGEWKLKYHVSHFSL